MSKPIKGYPMDAVTLGLIALTGTWLGHQRAKAKDVTLHTPTGLDLPDEILVTARRADFDTIARTIWAEARGEGFQGMQAVANVIWNRFVISQQTPGRMWWGETLEEICLAKNQFSAWRLDDPNRPLAMAVTDADPQFKMALLIALKCVGGVLADITRGATHYHAKSIKPYWTAQANFTASVKNHDFYNGVA